MRLVVQVHWSGLWRPAALLAASPVLFFLADCAVAVAPWSGDAGRDEHCAFSGFESRIASRNSSNSPENGVWRSSPERPESPPTGLNRRDDSALRRTFASRGSVARARAGGGAWRLVKSSSARRVVDAASALPGAGLLSHFSRRVSVAQVSWPMGQSAAESVVLLRRLLI